MHRPLACRQPHLRSGDSGKSAKLVRENLCHLRLTTTRSISHHRRHPEAAIAALPGVYRTAVGYCGGLRADPSYKSVCNDPLYDDYAEAITIDFFPSVLSYADVLDAFFRSHDAISGGRSRQYSSIIFAHDAEQKAVAEQALASQPRATTSLEEAMPFWEAEAYHKKWLLQRKAPLLKSLGLSAPEELLGAAPTVLNAVAAGKLGPKAGLARLGALVDSGELEAAAHDDVRAALDLL